LQVTQVAKPSSNANLGTFQTKYAKQPEKRGQPAQRVGRQSPLLNKPKTSVKADNEPMVVEIKAT
jgi:hypothetical protein